MKNKIEYYYQLININLYEKNGVYQFNYNKKNYMFFICNRTIEEIKELYLVLTKDNKYHKIILNKDKHLVSLINNRQYVLIELNQYNNETINIKDILTKQRIQNINNYNILFRSDWYNLWSKKIDYILYQREHIKNNYLVLDQYLDYFVGMTESAISYFKNIMTTEKQDNIQNYVISHRRIKTLLKNDFYNINELIIDHPVRDISEYFKYMFYSNNINYGIISHVIRNTNFSNYGYRLLFCRMLFPSYFFDLYEKIVNEKVPEKEINKIINKIPEYELYLSFIYREICKKNKIPNIDWIS